MLINYLLTKITLETKNLSFLDRFSVWGKKDDQYHLIIKLISDNKTELDTCITLVNKLDTHKRFKIEAKELDASHNTQYLCTLDCKFEFDDENKLFEIGENIKKQLSIDVVSEQKNNYASLKHAMIIDLYNSSYDVNDIVSSVFFAVDPIVNKTSAYQFKIALKF